MPPLSAAILCTLLGAIALGSIIPLTLETDDRPDLDHSASPGLQHSLLSPHAMPKLCGKTSDLAERLGLYWTLMTEKRSASGRRVISAAGARDLTYYFYGLRDRKPSTANLRPGPTAAPKVVEEKEEDPEACISSESLAVFFQVLVPFADPRDAPVAVSDGFAGAHVSLAPVQFGGNEVVEAGRKVALPGELQRRQACKRYSGCPFVDCYCCLHGWVPAGKAGFEACAAGVPVKGLEGEVFRDVECRVALLKWGKIAEPGGVEERPCWYAASCDEWLWVNTADGLRDPRVCLCETSPYKEIKGFKKVCVDNVGRFLMSV